MKKSIFLLLIAFLHQVGRADSGTDWGFFSVPVSEMNFRCDSTSFEFYLMPSLISKNQFRASDPSPKVEHHFAHYFTGNDACDYRRRLLKIAEEIGGRLTVRLVTSDNRHLVHTVVSQYGVSSCVEETREKLRVELPVGIAVTSNAESIKRLYFGECKSESSDAVAIDSRSERSEVVVKLGSVDFKLGHFRRYARGRGQECVNGRVSFSI